MKLKRTVFLVTVVVALGLWLGTSAAQTTTVITDEAGNVTGIANLEVLDNSGNPTIYNVEFVNDTALNVYASGKFDFSSSEDALTALEEVIDVLNAETPIPPGASSQGTDQFFIVSEEQQARLLAVGSQFISGVWDQCTTDCTDGVAELDPAARFTYAKFSTQDMLPGKATLISPTDTISDNTPTYKWNAVANSTWYHLVVLDSAWNAIVEWHTADAAGCGDGTGECSVTPATELANGAAWWFIQTFNWVGPGMVSEPLSFTVESTPLPGPATLISPNGTINDNTPAYTWNAVAESAQYRLFVWDSTETTVIDQWFTAEEAGCSAGTGQCVVTSATQLEDDTFEWWIQAQNESGRGPWSDELSFTVESIPPPGPATLISPSGTINDNTPTYTWNAVAESAQYNLFVWDSTKTVIIEKWYTANEAGCIGDDQCSVTPETVLTDGTFEWWIQTWNEAGGYGPWSDEMSFTVESLSLEKPTLISPEGEITDPPPVNGVTTPTYNWLGVENAKGYELVVYDSRENRVRTRYSADGANCADATIDRSCDVTPAQGVDINQNWSWEVRAFNDSGDGPWSDVMTFHPRAP